MKIKKIDLVSHRNIMVHQKCREEFYSTTDVKRFQIPEENLVFYEIDYPEYQPTDFTAEETKTAEWADPENRSELKFNQIDGAVDRRSFEGHYKIKNGVPINIKGRTGVIGRGLLGKWGPNHAADPIVTTWKRDQDNNIVHNEESGLPILKFVAIQRDDTGEFAIPGGMCDAGENVSQSLKREFGEEALNTDQFPDRKAVIDELLTAGELIYQGYVDDPRNTDNAWMETQVYNFHDEDGKLRFLKLEAGSDATHVEWQEINSSISLYASHSKFIRLTAKHRGAHW